MIAVRFAEWPMEPTESLVTLSKFDPPLWLWGKRWDGLPAFTHTRNHSLTDKRSTTWALLPGFRPSWSNCITLWDYCLCLAQDILLSEKLPTQAWKFGILFHSTAFLSKWEIHSQGNRRLKMKMDSSTEDAFQGKSHDTAHSLSHLSHRWVRLAKAPLLGPDPVPAE